MERNNSEFKPDCCNNIIKIITENDIFNYTEDEIKIQQAVRQGNAKELESLDEVKAIGIKIYLNE